ncbi:hypothetical protein [Bifidobacterium biavatii]|uniref:Uncharacterized protein n=1 Tax=Bifidobacterium biavatii DSM 23969 TaxID=1437608 RepID=A0A086ZYY0_9BIFI|nr:hypothetical protein [Bifidobacterium biavatii]KFI51730.1 hypothetical protein BBIA_0644 [Bifidobacterium biavatii DSM 23969]
MTTLPALEAHHDPGFVLRVDENPLNEGVLVVFDTVMPEFNLSFAVYVFPDRDVSICLQPAAYSFDEIRTADELSELADRCDRLQEWLDDCATVVDWTHENLAELAGKAGLR